MSPLVRSIALASLVMTLATVAGPAIGQEPVRVTIMRQTQNVACTTGYLSVNDRIVAYTLERPDIGNINDISSIPAGTYQATVRYDHSDAWRIELRGVPGRSNVQIHVGNWVTQTRGCILVGSNVSVAACSVQGSAAAYHEFQSAIYGPAAGPAFPEVTILVTVRDAR